MTKRILPFSVHPSSWGLTGRQREIAEAHYKYSGEELDRKVAEIETSGIDYQLRLAQIDLIYRHIDQYAYDHKVLELSGNPSDPVAIADIELKHKRITQIERDRIAARNKFKGNALEQELLKIDFEHANLSEYDYKVGLAKLQFPIGIEQDLAILSIDHAFGKLSDYDYRVKFAEAEQEGKDLQLVILDIKKEFNKISEDDYAKEKATINEEPWIKIIDSGFDPELGPNGVYFEFDWNEYMILYLRNNGYSGISDTAIIDMWFSDLCRAQGMGTTNGVIPFGGL